MLDGFDPEARLYLSEICHGMNNPRGHLSSATSLAASPFDPVG